MNKRDTFFIILILFVVIVVGLLSTASLSSAAEEVVAFRVQPNPKIDVVLAKSKTTTDVTNFKDDLLKALEEQGVNTEMVEISSVEAQNVDIASGFEWQQDVSASIGSISITNGGKSVVMKGNQTNPGKNAIWIIPEGNQEQEFNFSYNIDYGDSFNGAGMLLRVKQNGNTLEGYMLSFNNDGSSSQNWYGQAGNNYGAIWKFTYVIGQNGSNISKQLLKGMNINKSGTLNVKVTDSEIRVSGGGMSTEFVYTFTEEYGVGYGFFSDHYSHGCDEIGSFTLNNINLTTTKVRKFTEVLREPDWRDNSIRVLVNVGDMVLEELDQTNHLGELLSRLINEDIHFVAWGKDVNQAQYENLISNNNNNGKFINNTAYNTSITTTAEYIKSLIGEIDTNNQYLLLDGQTELVSDPEDVFTNTADENYPYGKWKIVHDYLYFENNIGQFAKSRVYLNDMIKTFDKTGKFTVTYADNAVDPSEIYVHRRPTALIKNVKDGANITLTSDSSDLDSYSQGNKGISEEEWKYKKTTDSDWTDGKLTTLEDGVDYVVQLRVKDLQNTWSYPTSVYATNRTEAPPLASFGIVNNIITKYDELEIIDESYDPYGGEITSETWEVYKGEEQIYTGSTPPTKYDEVGEYSMRLTVTNDRNITSETYIRKFEIIEDTVPPEFIGEPEECDWTQSVDVNLQFSDIGGSGFKSFKYAITDTQDEPTEWSEAITNNPGTVTITEEGEKYLHVKGIDNDGNESFDRVLGKYLIDNSGPTIEVTGDMENPWIDKLDLTLNVTDSLSGIKKITIGDMEVQNGTISFVKNGKYTITAEDNIGNKSTKTLNITNVYHECGAGLEHPIYSSDYESCPICASYEGLKVTNESDIYNAEKQGVKYDNPKGANIVEYYNNVKENPRNASKHSYELKVVYEGNEYKTGLTGTYEIQKRELTIDGIEAKNRTYDKSDHSVEITGGNLHNLVEGNPDNIGFKLNGAVVETNTVGTQIVKINNVDLTNNNPENYVLIQPDDISVEITVKTLTIENIKASDKIYDANNIISLSGGNLVGVCEGDEVGFVLPETGLAENKNIGQHKIQIEEITLTGTDAFNYILTQPTYGSITANITEKYIDIIDIVAEDKIYDGNAIINLKNGKLVEVCDGDEVNFILPKTGSAEDKNVRQHNIKIDEIKLEGTDAHNYVLNQPEYGSIKATINKREVTVEGLRGKDRKYDGTNIVEIIEGKLVNKVDGDDLIAVIPSTGIAENSNVGRWKVQIVDIVLTGTDSENYTIIQPEYGTITVSIIKEDAVLEAGVDSKKYDRNPVEPYVITNNSTSEVKFTFYKAGSNKEIEVPYDIGDYEMVASIESDGNYTEMQTERIPFSILKPDAPNIKLDAEIISVNGNAVEAVPEEGYQGVKYKDEFTLRINISNVGLGSGYASKLELELPEGIEFVETDEINNQYMWKLSGKKLETDIYSIEQNINNEIFTDTSNEQEQENETNDEKEQNENNSKDKTQSNPELLDENNQTNEEDEQIPSESTDDEQEPNDNNDEDTEENQTTSKYVDLVLKVTKAEKDKSEIPFDIYAEQQDKHGDLVEYTEENENGHAQTAVQYKYFDASIHNRIDELDLTYVDSKKTETFDVYQHENEIIKAELSDKRVDSSIATLKYKVVLKNEGNETGTVENIAYNLPRGISFSEDENNGWKLDEKGDIYYDEPIELKEGETKEVDLIIKWDLREGNLGARKSKAVLTSQTDLDQILIQEGQLYLQDTNNLSISEAVLSLPTGSNTIVYVVVILISLALLGGGIVLIKKYVI